MKLVLMRRDFVRCQILSRKISKRHLAGKGLEKLKIQYYEFMIQYYVHEKMILDCAKAYQTMFDTINKAEPELAKELDPQDTLKNKFFQNFVIYLLISPYENEKVDLMHILESLYARDLEKNDLLSRFVHKLLTYELMPLNESEIETQMASFDPFVEATENSKSHMRDFVR
jgi:26S proteasome regulatory subunit N5